MSSRTAACAESEPPARRRLSGHECVLIVVIIVIAAALALTGMAVITVLELVAGGGLVALHLSRRAPATPSSLA